MHRARTFGLSIRDKTITTATIIQTNWGTEKMIEVEKCDGLPVQLVTVDHTVTHLGHSVFDPTQHCCELSRLRRATWISRGQPAEHPSTHVNHLEERREQMDVEDGTVKKNYCLSPQAGLKMFNYLVESVLGFEYQRSPCSTGDSPCFL